MTTPHRSGSPERLALVKFRQFLSLHRAEVLCSPVSELLPSQSEQEIKRKAVMLASSSLLKQKTKAIIV